MDKFSLLVRFASPIAEARSALATHITLSVTSSLPSHLHLQSFSLIRFVV
jgi:hypothetical protein